MEEREEEDGCEAISTQDSWIFSKESTGMRGEIVPSLRSRGGIPDERAIVSIFCAWWLCAMVFCGGRLLFCRGDMVVKVGLESGEVRGMLTVEHNMPSQSKMFPGL